MDAVRCAVQVRLVGLPDHVELVAEYLRQSRRLSDESDDQPSSKTAGQVVRYLEVAIDEKQNGMRLAR